MVPPYRSSSVFYRHLNGVSPNPSKPQQRLRDFIQIFLVYLQLQPEPEPDRVHKLPSLQRRSNNISNIDPLIHLPRSLAILPWRVILRGLR